MSLVEKKAEAAHPEGYCGLAPYPRKGRGDPAIVQSQQSVINGILTPEECGPFRRPGVVRRPVCDRMHAWPPATGDARGGSGGMATR